MSYFFNKFTNEIETRKYKFKFIHLFYYIGIIMFVILLVAPILTRVRVSEDKEYNSKNEVALYLYKYDHLPSNFILEADLNNDYTLLLDGKNIGGDTYEYSGTITKKTKITELYECDICQSRKKAERGNKRLIYSVKDGQVKEIYYTSDYKNFDKVSLYDTNTVSNHLWVAFGLFVFALALGMLVIIVTTKHNKYIIIDDLTEVSMNIVKSPLYLLGFLYFGFEYIVIKLTTKKE